MEPRTGERMAVETTRGDILHLVAGGAMTPEDAEAEALRLGFEPFEIRPDPSQWDPMGEVGTSPWRSQYPAQPQMVPHGTLPRGFCMAFSGSIGMGTWKAQLIEEAPCRIAAAIKRASASSRSNAEDAVRLCVLAAQGCALRARCHAIDCAGLSDIRRRVEPSGRPILLAHGAAFPSRLPDAGYDMVTIPRMTSSGVPVLVDH
jgi:hypothetical protein